MAAQSSCHPLAAVAAAARSEPRPASRPPAPRATVAAMFGFLLLFACLLLQGCEKASKEAEDDDWYDDDSAYQSYEEPSPQESQSRGSFVKSYEEAEDLMKVRRGACQTGALVLPENSGKCKLGGYNTDFCGGGKYGLDTFCYTGLEDRACCCAREHISHDAKKKKYVAGRCNGVVEHAYAHNFAYFRYKAPKNLHTMACPQSATCSCPHPTAPIPAHGGLTYDTAQVPATYGSAPHPVQGGTAPCHCPPQALACGYNAPQFVLPQVSEQDFKGYQVQVQEQLELAKQQVVKAEEEMRIREENRLFLVQYEEQLRQSQVMIEERRLQHEQEAIRMAKENEKLQNQIYEFERQYQEQMQLLMEQVQQNQQQEAQVHLNYQVEVQGINQQAETYIQQITQLQGKMATNQEAIAGVCGQCEDRCPICGQDVRW